LELYNSSNKYLATKSLTLSDPSSTGMFSNDTICPKCHVVFTSITGKLQLEAFGIDAKVISGFPTLNNDGDELVLKDASNVLDVLIYNSSFYHDEFKSQGGWSLEKIQLDYMCANSNNWSASCDASGGSPGLANCSNHIFIDADHPMVQSVFVMDSNHVSVLFNEEVNVDSLSVNDFIIDEQINPLSITAGKIYSSKITLQVNLTLLPNEVHWLQLNDIIDCNGNKILPDNKYQFGIGVSPVKGDLIINEIMFNPYDNCVDFVEVYNKSDKIISIKNCSCSRRNSTTNQIEYNSKVTIDNLVIMPKDYLVLSNTNDNYFNCYPSAQISKSMFYELPVMNDDEGSILFLDAAAVVIDELKYFEKQHSQLLTINEGVSLERISADVSTSNDENWSSASYASGYATPTLKNSQAIDGSKEETIISITPTVFSPDNDGFDDHTLIEINSNIGGGWSSILIIDLNGNKIKQLLNADLIGSNDKLIWDGTDERNRVLPSGIYILYAEIISDQGQLQKIRKPIIIAEQRN
ncbi:MAG: lamin tail domain-containing protein, partial [Bacteroidota bacterium]